MMASSSNEPTSIFTGGDKRNLKLMMMVNSLKKEDPPCTTAQETNSMLTNECETDVSNSDIVTLLETNECETDSNNNNNILLYSRNQY
jgi:hypothetical protein